MKKEIYRASIFFAVIGLTLMYLSTLYLEAEKVEIGEIERAWAGKQIEVEGDITSFTESDGHVFITLEDSTGSIQVVDFDSELESDRGELLIEGRVDIYQGSLQIIADEIQT